MRDYETNNDIVNSVHGEFPFDTSPVTSPVTSPKTNNRHHNQQQQQHQREGPSSSSRMSLLTSSTLSLAHRQYLDWPEFEENYNSIMDNTNLLDSCAAALSDITYGDEDRSFVNSFEKQCHINLLQNRSIGSDNNSAKTSSSSSLSTQDTTDSIKMLSQRVIQEFVRWLDYMEQRIELLPALGKIVAMNSTEMIAQYRAHKRIFKEIVAQPCIIKGDANNANYKALAERYHLLYLKVYEVLLLLEDIPEPDENAKSASDTSISDDLNATHVNVLSDNSSMYSDKSDSDSLAMSASMYTRTNILSRSIGTFYFKHDDTASEQTATDKRTLSVGNIYEEIDKECEWKNDVNTMLFDVGDKKWTMDDAYTASVASTTASSKQSSLQRQLCQDDSMTQTSLQQRHKHQQQQSKHPASKHSFVQHKRIRRRYTIDSCTSIKHQRPMSLALPIQLNTYDRRHSIDTIDHKVREWLNTKTMCSTNAKSKSSWASLISAIDSDTDDLHALYRSKSDLNLPIYRCSSELRANNMATAAAAAATKTPTTPGATSSFRASSTSCVPLTVVANDTSSSSSSSSSVYEIASTIESLEWDAFVPDLTAMPNGMVNNDNEIIAMSEKLCYFGEDYSQQLDTKSIASSSTTEVNHILGDGTSKPTNASNAGNVGVDDSETVVFNVKKRTGRRRQQKVLRAKKRAFHSMLKMSQTGLTPKRTTAEASTETEPVEEKCSKPSETFEALITYNNTDKQFELRTIDTGIAQKIRVSEMRAEHFHELVAVCKTNIDCVITVIGAEPNQTFDAEYCRRMRKRRKMQMAQSVKCQCRSNIGHDGRTPESNSCSQDCKQLRQQENTENQQKRLIEKSACVCNEINHIICIVLNFLVDCWNIFRNMKLYIYLSRFIKTLFDSARFVADHIRSKVNNNTKMLKYH